MCRLFGFRSVVPSAVHRSLLKAENALSIQSAQHPDGWGVAYYMDGSPHIVKSPSPAQKDQMFHRVSGIVSSETVVAHIRKATAGPVSTLNAHPFQFGPWVFAHNGEIPDFEQFRGPLLELVPNKLRRFILGDTDSEVCFFLFLAEIYNEELELQTVHTESIAQALRTVRSTIINVTKDQLSPEKLLLNFLVTNGQAMVAYRQGKGLFWSSHKSQCEDRDHCLHFTSACESPAVGGKVQYLIVSSEPLGDRNVWNEVPEGYFIGVNSEMNLTVEPRDESVSPTADSPGRLRVV